MSLASVVNTSASQTTSGPLRTMPSTSSTLAFVPAVAATGLIGSQLARWLAGLGITFTLGGLAAYLSTRRQSADDFMETVLRGDPKDFPQRIEKFVDRLRADKQIGWAAESLGKEFKRALLVRDEVKAKRIVEALYVLNTGKALTSEMQNRLTIDMQTFLSQRPGDPVRPSTPSTLECVLEVKPTVQSEKAYRFEVHLTAKRDGRTDPQATANLEAVSTTSFWRTANHRERYSKDNRVHVNDIGKQIPVDPANPAILKVDDWSNTGQETLGLFTHHSLTSKGKCLFPESVSIPSTPSAVEVNWPPVPDHPKN